MIPIDVILFQTYLAKVGCYYSDYYGMDIVSLKNQLAETLTPNHDLFSLPPGCVTASEILNYAKRRYAEIVPKNGSHYVVVDGTEWARFNELSKAEALRDWIVSEWAQNLQAEVRVKP